MNITVDMSSAVPPFEQIRAQIVDLIEHGMLAPGTRLPSVRQLAVDLDLAPGTVARAYQKLEQVGVTTAHRRFGTRVAERAVVSQDERRRRLAELADSYVRAATRLGVEADAALAAVRAAVATGRAEPR